MSASGTLISILLLFGGVASGAMLISIGQIIRVLHHQYRNIWKRLGEPSGWGCRWKGCNRVDSLLNGHILIADCLLKQPEWAPKDDNIRKAIRRIRHFFWIFIASLVVSIPLAALLK